MALAAASLVNAIAQAAPAYHDPVPVSISFVPVDTDVRLEMLDWGGSGRPLVLLAGLGDTAHVFDFFAPLLTGKYHVYGLTRRGYGSSSRPKTGYAVERLGRDVAEVIESQHWVKPIRPILVGHSIAGEEMSWIANNRPELVAGLVYLDAAQDYAFHNVDADDLKKDGLALQTKLSKDPLDTNTIDQLLTIDLPRVEHELRTEKESLDLGPLESSAPTPEDKKNVATFGAFIARLAGAPFPEGELYQITTVNPDGSIGERRSDPTIGSQVTDGTQNFTRIPVPLLAIYACPHRLGGAAAQEDPAKLARRASLDREGCEAQAHALQKAEPDARVLIWPNTFHTLFLTRAADAAREIDVFAASLKTP